MLNIAINGINGKMGQSIVKVAKAQLDLKVLDFVELINGNIENKQDLVIIDFSAPDGCISAINWCLINQTPLVIGTTGFTVEQKQVIDKASNSIPIVMSPNMSLSVNVLFALSKLAAHYLPYAEVEIIEAHHRYKKDAPSGTAIGIGEAVASGRKQDFASVAKFQRERHTDEVRSNSEIGFSVIRGGDIVGQHTAMFILDGEELNITSNITNRDSFAAGAICAARFLLKQQFCKVYSMQDVLLINNTFA